MKLITRYRIRKAGNDAVKRFYVDIKFLGLVWLNGYVNTEYFENGYATRSDAENAVLSYMSRFTYIRG